MPYVRRSTRFAKSTRSRASAFSRRGRAKSAFKRVRRVRRTRPARYVANRLGSGLQWHTSSYAGTRTLAINTAPRTYVEEVVRDIPKYRNDIGADKRQANLQQARVRDRIFLKGFKVKLCVISLDTVRWITFRHIAFRNNSWDEAIDIGGTNWMKVATDGAINQPAIDGKHLAVQKFNHDLYRGRRDFFYDRQMQLAPLNTNHNTALREVSFWVPVNQVVEFESKGDTTSAQHLKYGRYWFLYMIGSHDASNSGDVKFNYTIDAVWAES